MIAGFFYPETKKVYIMIDNSINKFGFASNDILASTETTLEDILEYISIEINNKKK